MDSRFTRRADEHAIPTAYVAPQIEYILSREDLEREVLYAGLLTDDDDPWTNIPD